MGIAFQDCRATTRPTYLQDDSISAIVLGIHALAGNTTLRAGEGSVEALKSMKALRKLNIYKLNISPQSVAAIRQALPECKVTEKKVSFSPSFRPIELRLMPMNKH